MNLETFNDLKSDLVIQTLLLSLKIAFTCHDDLPLFRDNIIYQRHKNYRGFQKDDDLKSDLTLMNVGKIVQDKLWKHSSSFAEISKQSSSLT